MRRTTAFIATILVLGVHHKASAETDLVLFSGGAMGGALKGLDIDGRFVGRLHSGGGFLSVQSGSGLFFEGAITAEVGQNLRFQDGLRAEGGVRVLTSLGTIRIFGGRALTSPAGHGGFAYGIHFPATEHALITPELGLQLGKGPDGRFLMLVTLQVLGDWLWGRW